MAQERLCTVQLQHNGVGGKHTLAMFFTVLKVNASTLDIGIGVGHNDSNLSCLTVLSCQSYCYVAASAPNGLLVHPKVCRQCGEHRLRGHAMQLLQL